VQHTNRISKATPLLSYLPRFIKIFKADFERSAIMSKHPPLNYPPLDRLSHKTPNNRIPVFVLFHFQSFILIPLVFSSPATVTEYRGHTTFFKKTLFPKNVMIHQNLNTDFFHDDNTCPIGKVKREND